MLLSAIGLVFGLTANFMALAGISLLSTEIVVYLNIGFFIVWVPAVLVSIYTTRNASKKDFWKVALSGCPAWMKAGLYALLVYGFVNLLYFATSKGVDVTLSENDGLSLIRKNSGQWIICYGLPFAILYSSIHALHLFRNKLCTNGHKVNPSASFCPECGQCLPEEPQES